VNSSLDRRLHQASFVPFALALACPAFTGLTDEAALELGKDAQHLKHGAAR